MYTITQYTQIDSKPKAIKLLLTRGNHKRGLWLPLSLLVVRDQELKIKEDWLYDKTIKPVMDQGWVGMNITKENQ